MCSWCKQQFQRVCPKQCGVGQIRYLLCVVLLSRERVSSDVIRSRTCRKAVNAVKVTSTTETFRNVEDGMWRRMCSTYVVCSALSCNGLSRAANLANLMKLRMSCRETLGAQLYESLWRGTELVLLVVRHWILRIYEFLQWGDLEVSRNETMNAK